MVIPQNVKKSQNHCTLSCTKLGPSLRESSSNGRIFLTVQFSLLFPKEETPILIRKGGLIYIKCCLTCSRYLKKMCWKPWRCILTLQKSSDFKTVKYGIIFIKKLSKALGRERAKGRAKEVGEREEGAKGRSKEDGEREEGAKGRTK